MMAASHPALAIPRLSSQATTSRRYWALSGLSAFAFAQRGARVPGACQTAT